MKPPFALSLSFDGIRLLHRAAGGWRVVGDVALDAADLAADLDALRDRAEALEPGKLYSKLLLPNEQIKYLTIETAGMEEPGRRAAAVHALAGATPYAVDDLAFDISIDGDRTHIAAVAHETLAEAESFAVEHQFQPVCFAAIPGEEEYLGEPFFGPTAAAGTLLEENEKVAPDGIAVVIIGAAEMPPKPPAPEILPSGATVVEDEPKAGAISVNETAPDVALQPEPEQIPAVPPLPHPALPEDTTAKSEPVNASSIVDPDQPAPVTETRSAIPPMVGFASRRPAEKTVMPSLGGASRRDAAALPPEPRGASVGAGHIPLEGDDLPKAPPPPQAAPLQALPRHKGSPSSRPGTATAQPEPKSAPTPAIAQAGSERERMTIFGARSAQVGGKPRFLGLMLTAALLVFLAGVAAWASVFLDDGLTLSRLFGDRAAQVAEAAPEELEPSIDAEQSDDEIEIASLDPELTPEDTAVLDALAEPAVPELPQAMTPAEIEAKYAADGIYPSAPEVPPAPATLVDLEDLYLTSIDPVSTTTDAFALPDVALFNTDEAPASVPSPVAAGTQFALNAMGLVIPTAQGALSPDGYMVFQGRPPLTPPATPSRLQTAPEEDAIIRSAIAAFRPNPRPGDLNETVERAQLDGLTRSELAGYRPSLRPPSVQELAAAAAAEPLDTDAAVTEALTAPDPLATATRLAAQVSLRPDTRPKNFAKIVQQAQQAAPREETRVASAASVAPRSVTPSIPSTASVARAATTNNAINLRKVNLIGVYGKPSSRRALVRLSNGRYQKVVVGDRVDGGIVSAIGESELRYTKRGRNVILKMPN